MCIFHIDGYSRRGVEVRHGGRRQGAWTSMLSTTDSTKNLPVYLPYYPRQVSPLEDRLRASLPGENMGPIQEEIRQ